MAARTRAWRRLRPAAPLLLIALLAGCMLPPVPASQAGRDVFNLYLVILAMAAVVFIGVEGFILYAIFRYRRRPGDDTLPPQTHGNNLVEVIWTAIPTVIVLVLFGASMIALGSVEARAEEPGVEIEATGFQFQWRFRYDDGDANAENDIVVTGTADNPPVMRVPVGEPVRVRLPSLDVIHSFYVPKFLIKRDVVPVGENDAPNVLEFTVTEPGTFGGQCAEFCGAFHADMVFTVEAMPRDEFDAWVASGGGPEETPGATVPPDAEVIELSATGLDFSTDRLEVPAGEPFIIRFEITDSQNHNVSIYAADGEALFVGEIFQGPEVMEYQVPALEPGEYEFICDVHPDTMVGTLVASDQGE